MGWRCGLAAPSGKAAARGLAVFGAILLAGASILLTHRAPRLSRASAAPHRTRNSHPLLPRKPRRGAETERSRGVASPGQDGGPYRTPVPARSSQTL
ncbi:hypothetical protein F4780DRAFT_742693, partial [Xylariomycetidae sp. FL0641]